MVKLICQHREHLSAPGIVHRKRSGCCLQRLYAIGVDRAELGGGGPSLAIGEHGARELVRVVELVCERRGVQQRPAKPGVPALTLGLTQADQQRAALRTLAAGRLLVQDQRLAKPPRRFIGSELLERTFARLARVVDGLRGTVRAGDGGGPVPGELTRALRGLLAALHLQGFRDALVESSATGRADFVVERVLDEHVGEGEVAGPLRALLKQRCRDRLFEQVEKPFLGEIEDGEEEVEVEVATDRRGGPEDSAGV